MFMIRGRIRRSGFARSISNLRPGSEEFANKTYGLLRQSFQFMVW